VARFLSFDFQDYFLQLLSGLEPFGDSINGLVPLNQNIPLINTSINELIMVDPHRLGDILKLHGAVSAYFGDVAAGGGFPTLDGLFAALLNDLQAKMAGLDLLAAVRETGGNPELRIDFAIERAFELEMDLDLGAALESIGFSAAASARIDVSGNISADGALVLDLNGVFDAGTAIDDAVFFELNRLNVDLTLNVTDIDLGLESDFIEAAISDAGIYLSGGVDLTLADADKRVSLAALTATSFNDLFDIDVDDIVMKMAVDSLEVFAGVGRDMSIPREGKGILVTAEDFAMVVYGEFPEDAGTGDILPPVWRYALTGQGSGALVGIDEVTLSGVMTVRVNETGRALAETVETGGDPIDVVFAAGEENLQRLEISGEITVADFFFLNGDFIYEKRTVNVDLSDGNPAFEAELMTVSGADIKGFAGSGPYFTDLDGDGQVTPTAGENGDGVIETHESDELSASAVGLWFEGIDFALAMLKETDASGADLRSWMGLKARAGTAALVGIPVVTVTTSNLLVEINEASGANGVLTASPLNWTSALDLNDDTVFGDTLDPGQYFDIPVDLAFDFTGPFMHVEGDITLDFEFISLSGHFDFSTRTVDVDLGGDGSLDGGDLDDATLTTLALSGVAG